MKIKILAAACIVFAQTVVAQTLSSSLHSLIETERAFAAMSLEKGMKTAFLTYLADDGILFRPGPVNGKERWRQRPDSSAARLEWAPIYADIAASGDVGYTTGWSIFTLSPDLDQPPSYGYFVTVWKKEADGTWKFALDLGIGIEHPEKIDRTFSAPDVSLITNKGGNVKAEQARISKLETRFSELSKRSSASAIKTFGADNIRLYREGNIPSVNRGEAVERLASLNERMTSSVEKLFVAPSCDAAYTYGKYDATYGGASEKSSAYFVHIWKKNSASEWKLVLDILNPPPSPPPSNTKVSGLLWLVGTWKMPAKGGAMFEQWRVADDSTLHGKSFKVNAGGDTVMLESVQLTSRNGALHYTPIAFGQNNDKPVPFKIIANKEREFTAENMEHDFPQRIIYKLKSKTQLRARIEGTVNGKLNARDFSYKRVDGQRF